ncbi:hypothetical protein QBC44DRAFT_153636 [Cladorrhinum sp. PSN332]|nr:hypothetical protein QBC44DRAFT_153636 [Cladorrhinum sp. PSN332]
MEVLILIATFFLGLAQSQNLSGQPTCATNCIISAVSAAGCAPQDLSCQCGPTKASIGASAAPCLLASCTGTELIQAQSAGNAQCSSFYATAAEAVATGTQSELLVPNDGAPFVFTSPSKQAIMNMGALLTATATATTTATATDYVSDEDYAATVVKPTEGVIVQKVEKGQQQNDGGDVIFYSRIPVNAAASNSWLKLLNEEAASTTTTARSTTTTTHTGTSTSTTASTRSSATAGAAGSLKAGLGGLLGVVGVMVAGL